jgi:hypothetical protein
VSDHKARYALFSLSHDECLDNTTPCIAYAYNVCFQMFVSGSLDQNKQNRYMPEIPINEITLLLSKTFPYYSDRYSDIDKSVRIFW